MSASVYLDRRTGQHRHDPVHRADLLTWLHENGGGWLLTRWILSRRFVSRGYAWLNRRRRSTRKIPGFVRAMRVDMDESLRPVDGFDSFADFIVRRIDLARRPARYLRLTIDATERCPPWHHGAPGPSWFFLDELEVR